MAHPGGRPSKYDPKFCQMLIDHGKEGKSFESFAGKIGITKDTLYNWFEDHKEFSDAKKQCVEFSRTWWESKSIEALEEIDEYDEKGKRIYSKKINPTVLIFNMKNRFRDQWQDRIEVDSNVDMKAKIDANVSVNAESLAKELAEKLTKAK